MPIESNTRNEPISKGKFHKRLKKWLANNEGTIGIEGDAGRAAPVYVQDGTEVFRLNKETTRAAVVEYLELVARFGNDLEWKRVRGQRGVTGSVGYGPECVRIKSFCLHAIG